MLERVTLWLNTLAAIAILVTGIYVLVVFGDIITESAKVVISIGIAAYMLMQIDVRGRVGNKN